MKALIVAASLLLSFSAFAGTSPKAGDKSAVVCAADDAQTCVQLQFLADVNSSSESSFIVNIATANNAQIYNLKVDLWMKMGSHGHGSAPVEIENTSANVAKVTNAWFVMSGPWLIRVDFDLNGQHQHLEIPVYVAQ